MVMQPEWEWLLSGMIAPYMRDHNICLKVAFVNRKGGPGKSSNLVNLAGELALRGHNVGIVDTDSQGGSHAARLLGLEQEDGLFHALIGIPDGPEHFVLLPLQEHVRQVPLDSYLAPLALIDDAGEIQALPFVTDETTEEVFLEQSDETAPRWRPGNIYVLPAGQNTFQIPWLLADETKFETLLNDMHDQYQLSIILIDTGPSMNLFDGVIYEAMDAFVYVTELEALSLFALSDVFSQVENASIRRQQRGRTPNRVLGIIPNKYRNLKEHVENLIELRKTFGDMVWEPVRLLKTYPKMAKYGQTIRALSSRTPEAREVVITAHHFEREALAWLEQSAKR